MAINLQKLEKFCQDYSKVSVDFALGNCPADAAQARQKILKENFVFEHSGFLKRLRRNIQDFLLDF